MVCDIFIQVPLFTTRCVCIVLRIRLYNMFEKTLTEKWRESHTQTWMIYFGKPRCHSRQKRVNLYECKNSLTCVHILVLSSDWEWYLWSPKYIIQVSVCLCLCVTFIQRSLHFSVRAFPFFSYLLCYPYFGIFLSRWSLYNTFIMNVLCL